NALRRERTSRPAGCVWDALGDGEFWKPPPRGDVVSRLRAAPRSGLQPERQDGRAQRLWYLLRRRVLPRLERRRLAGRLHRQSVVLEQLGRSATRLSAEPRLSAEFGAPALH